MTYAKKKKWRNIHFTGGLEVVIYRPIDPYIQGGAGSIQGSELHIISGVGLCRAMSQIWNFSAFFCFHARFLFNVLTLHGD
jgi:hypothetical protein